MKKRISLLPFLIATIICSAQTDSLINTKFSGNFCSMSPDVPSFPGGGEKLSLFINQTFHDSLIKPGTEGRIFMQITVDTSGQFKKLTVLHGINSVLDSEMLRVFSIMPKWIPAEKNGKKVESEFVLPVKVAYRSNDQ